MCLVVPGSLLVKAPAQSASKLVDALQLKAKNMTVIMSFYGLTRNFRSESI